MERNKHNIKEGIPPILWMPQTIFSDQNINSLEKFILTEILNLLKIDRRYCWASNKHFADMFGRDETVISKAIKHLQNAGWIKYDSVKICTLENCQLQFTGCHRHIYPNHILENVLNSLAGIVTTTQSTPLLQNCNSLLQNCNSPIAKMTPPIQAQNKEYNYLNNNNNNNNLNIKGDDVVNTKHIERWQSCPLNPHYSGKFDNSFLREQYPDGHDICERYVVSIENSRKRGFANTLDQRFALHNLLEAGYTFRDIDALIEKVEDKKGKHNWDFKTLCNWADKEGALPGNVAQDFNEMDRIMQRVHEGR